MINKTGLMFLSFYLKPPEGAIFTLKPEKGQFNVTPLKFCIIFTQALYETDFITITMISYKLNKIRIWHRDVLF